MYHFWNRAWVHSLFSIAGTVSTAVSYVKDVGLETLRELFVPVYTFLLVIFVGWFIRTIAKQINAIRPSRKFANLKYKIFLAYDAINEFDGKFYIDNFYDISDLESLRYKLANMGIVLPSIQKPDDLEALKHTLLMLLSYAKDGRIKEARNYTDRWT